MNSTLKRDIFNSRLKRSRFILYSIVLITLILFSTNFIESRLNYIENLDVDSFYQENISNSFTPLIILGFIAAILGIILIILSVRRVRDAGYSGYFSILMLTPLFIFYLLILALLPTKTIGNKYIK